MKTHPVGAELSMQAGRQADMMKLRDVFTILRTLLNMSIRLVQQYDQDANSYSFHFCEQFQLESYNEHPVHLQCKQGVTKTLPTQM